MTMQNFLNEMKAKAEKKAKEMAKLELSVWDNKHESELKVNFRFTNKSLSDRKINLSKLAN